MGTSKASRRRAARRALASAGRDETRPIDQDEILIQAFGRAQGIKVPPKVVDDFRRLVGRARSLEDGGRDKFDALDAVERLAAQLRLAESDLAVAVALARGLGASWSQVGRFAGVNDEAARYRWGRK